METYIFLVRGLFGQIGESLTYLSNLGLEQFVITFWAFIFLEIPRYLLTDVYVLVRHFLKQDDRAQNGELYASVHPKVSVLLSVLNEEHTIAASIQSLREQSHPNLEILVIDDGSTDGTSEICSRLETLGLIRFFGFAARQGKSAALNYGCRMAHGEFIVFMDSDSTLDREAITKIIQYFDDEKIGAVSGNIGVRNQQTNLLTKVQTIEYLTSLTIGRQFRSSVKILGIVSGAFGAFRRELIDRIGWHEPGPGQDSDLTIRIRKLGKHIAFAPDATCLTNVPVRWVLWIRQRMRWDRNVVKNRLRKHKDTYNIWHHHFSLSNVLSFIDTVFFSLFLSFTWLVYLFQVLSQHPDRYGIIIFANYALYSLTKTTQFFIALTLSDRRTEYRTLIWSIPFMIPYRLLSRMIRMVASFQELLWRSSSRDPFAPEKVRKQMEIY